VVRSIEGTKFNPNHLSGLIDASSPTNAAELQQFLCPSNWMRTAIPRYAELADPLLRLLRQCQDDVGSSKQKLRLYRLSKLWDAAVEMQFVQLRDAIVKRVNLSHPDSAQALVYIPMRLKNFTRQCLRRCLSKTWKNILMKNDMNDLHSFQGGL
jgi:hypothetical protein